MTETTAPIAVDQRTSPAARIGWAILILATLYICYFSHLGAIGFVGPDEPRYAWIARDMAETGDWVTPRLYGKPWFEKPPLLYWGAALCFKLFGVSEAAARLPSAISALLATLALAWLAVRLYGTETARWLLLLLPTTVGTIGFSHAASTDMPFSAMLTITIVCAAVVLGLRRNENSPVLPQTPWLALVLFGFFLGLAVLAKGPAGIILVGGAVFFWALFTKRWRDTFRLFHPVALASFFATALPWYVLCARRNPDFFRIFIIEHNFKRFLTPEFQHIQPFWYYVPVLLIALAPWIPWVISFRPPKPASSSGGEVHAASALFLMWAVFPMAFFTISKSKLPGYILPVLAPCMLLLVALLRKLIQQNHALARWPLMGIGALFACSAIWAFHDLYQFRDYSRVHWAFVAGPFFVVFFSVPAFVGGIVTITAALLSRVRLAQTVAVISFLLMLVAAQDALGKFNMDLSARIAASEIEQVDALSVYAFRVQRGWLYQLNFYLHREVPQWTPGQPGVAIVVLPRKAVLELKRNVKVLDVIYDFSEEANILRVVPLSDPASR